MNGTTSSMTDIRQTIVYRNGFVRELPVALRLHDLVIRSRRGCTCGEPVAALEVGPQCRRVGLARPQDRVTDEGRRSPEQQVCPFAGVLTWP